MREWKEYKLSDIMEIVGGGTPKTTIPEYWDGNIPWLSVTDFNTGRKYVFDTEKTISKKGLQNSSTRLLKKGQIIISARGTVGALTVLGRDMAFNQSSYGLEAKQEFTFNDYLYYLLKNNVSSLLNNTHGAVFDTITRETFNHISVELPPLPEQKTIASILSSLDNKIDLLHRQNKTLEALAETLFRQWFVEEAEGMWETKTLKEVCYIINGFAFKSEDYRDEGRIIIRTMNFENGFIDTTDVVHISFEDVPKYEKYQLKRFDFLLVMVGASIGNFSIVTSNILPALQNQNMWNFRANGALPQHYLNFALRTIIKDNIGSASGSAREFFQKSQFYEFQIPIPPQNKLFEFNELVEHYYSKIELSLTQIRTLTRLRDTLLPKLMSGEIRVKNVDRFVET